MLKLIKGRRDRLEEQIVRELFSGDGGTERAYALARNLDRKARLRVVPANLVAAPMRETSAPPKIGRGLDGHQG
jgi:hypothetical protein